MSPGVLAALIVAAVWPCGWPGSIEIISTSGPFNYDFSLISLYFGVVDSYLQGCEVSPVACCFGVSEWSSADLEWRRVSTLQTDRSSLTCESSARWLMTGARIRSHGGYPPCIHVSQGGPVPTARYPVTDASCFEGQLGCLKMASSSRRWIRS